MEIATVTSKGQITIPIAIRKLLDLDKGDKVILENDNGKIVMINASKCVDMNSLIFASNKISSEDALKDEEPFDWSEEVLNGEKKVEL